MFDLDIDAMKLIRAHSATVFQKRFGTMAIPEESFLTRVKPSTNFKTADPAEGVTLRISKDAGNAGKDPMSVPHVLLRAATDYPDHPALMQKGEDGSWNATTYREYRENVLKTAKIFIKLGLEPQKSVAILAFNSPEWFVSELAAIHAG